MKANFLNIIVILLALILPQFAMTQESEKPVMDWQATATIALEPEQAKEIFLEAITREDYPHARAVVDSLASQGPQMKPWANLYEATLLATEAADFGNEEAEEKFETAVDSARQAFDDEVDRVRDVAPAEHLASLYYALGSLALLDAQWANEVEGRPLAAAGPAMDAHGYFKDTLELQPDHMGALTGAAAYRFFKSHVLSWLTWTPFMSDHRDEAIEQMRKAANTPGPYQPAAVTTLTWSLIEMDRAEEAAKICNPWAVRYPDSRHFLEPCAKAHFVSEYWSDASRLYARYIDALLESPEINEERLLGAINRAAQAARNRGNWQAVLDYANMGLNRPISDEQWNQFDYDFKGAFEEYKDQARQQIAADE